MIGLIFGETSFPTEILKKIKKKRLNYLIIDLSKSKKFKKDKKSYSVSIGEFGKIINILKDNKCNNPYDPYLGVSEMLPKAFGLSAKSYEFDANGNETILDYYKLISIVKKAGYNGFIGVEYEGEILSEKDGIIATKKLLEKAAKML